MPLEAPRSVAALGSRSVGSSRWCAPAAPL